MRIEIGSHFVVVRDIPPMGKEALLKYCGTLIKYKLARKGKTFVREMDKVFAFSTKDRSEFRFHINQLNDVKHALANYGFTESNLQIVDKRLVISNFPVVEHPLNDDFKKSPRDYQEEIIQYVIDDGVSKLTTLQTGKGKTFIAQTVMNRLRLRTMFYFKGGYTKRWVDSLTEMFDYKKGDLVVINSSTRLIKLMKDALADRVEAKSIIITHDIMRGYISDYRETSGNSKTYPIPPEDFCATVGIGYVIKDELHQNYHQSHVMELFLNTYKVFSLSATMISSDPAMNKFYQIAYPMHMRNSGTTYDAYVNCVALYYRLKDPDRPYRHMGSIGYSHVIYEESIMGNSQALFRYLEIIDDAFNEYFVNIYKPGMKTLVFCETTAMCTHVTRFLTVRYSQYDVGRYCGTIDPYENLIENDVVVTTIKAAGTAVDIPDLVTVFMTPAMNSGQSNEQVKGRTRRLASYPDVMPYFVYFVCEDIPKHMEYDKTKRQIFSGLVKAHASYYSTRRL